MRTTTHCAKGHERTPDNLNSANRCKTCAREYARKRATTHCPKGHERTPQNVAKDRSCRTCKNAASTERKRRKRAEAAQITAATTDDTPRTQHNRAGLTHYIQRRRQRLARQNLAA